MGGQTSRWFLASIRIGSNRVVGLKIFLIESTVFNARGPFPFAFLFDRDLSMDDNARWLKNVFGRRAFAEAPFQLLEILAYSSSQDGRHG